MKRSLEVVDVCIAFYPSDSEFQSNSDSDDDAAAAPFRIGESDDGTENNEMTNISGDSLSLISTGYSSTTKNPFWKSNTRSKKRSKKDALVLALPDEILHVVASLLPDNAVCNFASVCASWRDLLNCDVWWRERCYKRWGARLCSSRGFFSPNESWKKVYTRRRKLLHGYLVLCIVGDGQQQEGIMGVEEMVGSLGGKTTKVFTSDVNLLLVDQVGTKKFNTAIKHHVEVKLPAWVMDCYERSVIPRPNIYVPRTLEGFRICVSGLSREHRELVEEACPLHGAAFFSNLVTRGPMAATHLVVAKAEGRKFEVATLVPEIVIVTPAWLTDSLIAKRSLPSRYYQPQPVR